MSYFTGEDLVFYKENDKIMSGGYSSDSILLKEGFSPMMTLNESYLASGGKKERVSNLFENLAVPAGLFYIPQTSGVKHNNEYNYDEECEHFVLSDDIHEQLFKLIEVDKKKKQGTKKNTSHKIKLSRKNKNKK